LIKDVIEPWQAAFAGFRILLFDVSIDNAGRKTVALDDYQSLRLTYGGKGTENDRQQNEMKARTTKVAQ